MNFAIPANHWVKIKDREKLDKYVELAREKERCEK